MKKVLRKIGRWFKQLFTKNMGMKIGALVFAFLLWSFVIADQNPVRDKVFTDVMVTYTQADTLKQRGLTSAAPFSDVLESVTVTVEARAESISQVTKDMVSAQVDLSTITEAGTYTLDVTASTTWDGARVINVEPNEVELEIEAIDVVDVPVEVELLGEEQDWLYYGEPIMAGNTVQVTGARSNVEQVARAVCYIDVTDMETSTKANRPVTLIDDEGETLPADMFTNITTVIVEVPIYPKREGITIDIAALKESITGVAEDYEITEITVDPETVDIAGPLDKINSINQVTLEPIELTDATSDQIIEDVKVQVPDGVYAVIPATVTVSLKIEQEEEMQTYEAVDVAVKNLGPDMEAQLDPKSINVNVYGTKAALSDFSADQLEPFVDLQGLGRGVHTLAVKFQNEPDLDVRLEPVTKTITVLID